MIIAYYRVSTDKQGRSGLGLEAQRDAVHKFARSQGRDILSEYTEIESGRRSNRPVLRKAVDHARMTRSLLVVAKLDRLARDARLLLTLVDSGIGIRFLDLPDFATEDPIGGRLILTVMAGMAEFEARRISQRVREALRQVKARGKPLGADAPTYRAPSAEHMQRMSKLGTAARIEAIDAYRRIMAPVVIELAKDRTLRATAAELNRLGYRTLRGRKWKHQAVHALLCQYPEKV